MKIYQSIADFKSDKKTVVTIGTFDGVHAGHRKIIGRLLESARILNAESLILTFFPHPRFVIQNSVDFHLLNTQDEKKKLLAQTGLDNLVIHPFDHAFSQLSAREFVEKILVRQLRLSKIIIGHDHRFGKGRTAGIHDLIEFGKEFHFDVEQIGAKEIDAVSISSTKIRKALADGDVTKANAYLDYNYLISGEVVTGRQLGRTIGFPTANIQIPEVEKLIPKDGVYIVRSFLGGKLTYGMMNIGTRPTVDGTSRSVEVHFLQTDADLYGKQISVELLHRIREEKKFESVDALKAQIERDLSTTQAYISSL